MPVIRYRTRDLTRLLPGTARPGMRRMEKITGRSDDMIILRGVNLFPTQIEELLLATDWSAGHFQLELTRPHRMDEMTVHVESRPDAFASLDTDTAAHELVHHIKATIGVSTRVIIHPPGAIERSLGKAKRVLDRRPKEA
jgi:phenylacetate-CoA ligase